MSSLELHGAAHIAPFMPKWMQEIGTNMHRAASQFAREAQDASVTNDLRPALSALGTVMQQCVACHAVPIACIDSRVISSAPNVRSFKSYRTSLCY